VNPLERNLVAAFLFSGKEPMSPAKTASPVLSTEEQKASPSDSLAPKEKSQEVKDVERDFAIARSHQRNGMYELVVTPESRVIRRADKATARADIDGFSCAAARALTRLYEQHCPTDAKVRTIVEKPLASPLDEKQEDTYLLRVRFTFTQSTKKGHRFFNF